MDCFGKFKGDRVCCLCELMDGNSPFSECKKIHNLEKMFREKIWRIKSKCPHRDTSYEDYQKYYCCKLKAGRDDECNCTLDCEKYINGGS